MIKPLIIEALEDIGPCDIETLSGYMGQSENMINSLLVNYMRKGMVRCINSSAAPCILRAYELTEKARIEYGTDEPAAGRSGRDVAPAPVESVEPLVLEPVTAPAAENTAVEITVVAPAEKAATEEFAVVRNEGGSKSDVLRQFLKDNGGEMSSRQLAEASGFPVSNIGGLLSNDVKKGRIDQSKTDDGRSVYRWIIGVDRTAKNEDARQHRTRASKGIEGISGGADRQHNNVAVSDEKPPVSETPASPATITIPVMVESITVPTSAVLTRDLYDLDTELVSLTERLKALREDRERKTQMLLAVQKLEELMKGDKQ